MKNDVNHEKITMTIAKSCYYYSKWWWREQKVVVTLVNDDDDNNKMLGKIFKENANDNLWSLITPSLGARRKFLCRPASRNKQKSLFSTNFNHFAAFCTKNVE